MLIKEEVIHKSMFAYVASLVGIFRVSTSSDGSSGSNTAVDRVDGTESIDVNLQVRQSLIGARLESESITSRSGVESVDRSENSVRVLSRAASTGVRGDVSSRGVPVRL